MYTLYVFEYLWFTQVRYVGPTTDEDEDDSDSGDSDYESKTTKRKVSSTKRTKSNSFPHDLW